MHGAANENKTGKRTPGWGEPPRPRREPSGERPAGHPRRLGPGREGSRPWTGAGCPGPSGSPARSNFPAFLRQAAEKAAEQPLSCK